MAVLSIRHEFIWKNTPEQNRHAELFYKTFKNGYMWPREFESYQDVEAALADAFEDYNKHRIHSATGHMTPAESAAR